MTGLGFAARLEPVSVSSGADHIMRLEEARSPHRQALARAQRPRMATWDLRHRDPGRLQEVENLREVVPAIW
jgi:hypothetical protein